MEKMMAEESYLVIVTYDSRNYSLEQVKEIFGRDVAPTTTLTFNDGLVRIVSSNRDFANEVVRRANAENMESHISTNRKPKFPIINITK